MKVAIITMISDNYGNRLQNYALQEVLTRTGNTVETLNNPWEKNYNYHKEALKNGIKKFIYFILKKPARYNRKIKFDRFNKRNIKFSNLWINRKAHQKKASEMYDLFICGSDQIWNSEADEIDGKYFAAFANTDRRASYAASFGIENVVEDRKDEFAGYLSGMKHISLRECSGVKIVKNLTGRNAQCHIDPTLLLSACDWDKLETAVSKPTDKYIFCYFLGKPAENVRNELKRYSRENHIKVFAISNEKDATHNNAGPDEFISLIKNAEFVLTDSFHGTVFSVIYHKPFYTFSRNGVNESMDTRVLSLLKLIELEDRFEPVKFNLDERHFIDYKKTDLLVDKERIRAMKYLTAITKCQSCTVPKGGTE